MDLFLFVLNQWFGPCFNIPLIFSTAFSLFWPAGSVSLLCFKCFKTVNHSAKQMVPFIQSFKKQSSTIPNLQHSITHWTVVCITSPISFSTQANLTDAPINKQSCQHLCLFNIPLSPSSSIAGLVKIPNGRLWLYWPHCSFSKKISTKINQAKVKLHHPQVCHKPKGE